MSLHSSLKTSSGALNSHRNVLTRTERIEKLLLEEKFERSTSPALGLVKVRSIKVTTGKKPKKVEGEEGADGAAAGAAGGAKAGAAGGAKAGAAGGAKAGAAGGAKAGAAGGAKSGGAAAKPAAGAKDAGKKK